MANVPADGRRVVEGPERYGGNLWHVGLVHDEQTQQNETDDERSKDVRRIPWVPSAAPGEANDGQSCSCDDYQIATVHKH